MSLTPGLATGTGYSYDFDGAEIQLDFRGFGVKGAVDANGNAATGYFSPTGGTFGSRFGGRSYTASTTFTTDSQGRLVETYDVTLDINSSRIPVGSTGFGLKGGVSTSLTTGSTGLFARADYVDAFGIAYQQNFRTVEVPITYTPSIPVVSAPNAIRNQEITPTVTIPPVGGGAMKIIEQSVFNYPSVGTPTGYENYYNGAPSIATNTGREISVDANAINSFGAANGGNGGYAGSALGNAEAAATGAAAAGNNRSDTTAAAYSAGITAGLDPSSAATVSSISQAVDRAQDRAEGNSSGKPVVIDLDGDGVELTRQDQSLIHFDWDNDGFRERTGWVGKDDGLLVFDENSDGQVTSAREIALSQWTTVEGDTDVEALRSYFDTNNDGKFNANDAQWSKFKVWKDTNQNAKVDSNEMVSLASLGITEFKLGYLTSQIMEMLDGSVVNGLIEYTSIVNGQAQRGVAGDVGLIYGKAGVKTVETADAVSNTSEHGFTSKSIKMGSNVSNYDVDNSSIMTDDSMLINAIVGNSLNNTITATKAYADLKLEGGSGNDTIQGGDGNDVIMGGAGSDVLSGGAGDDVLYIDDADGMAQGNIGYDLVVTSGSLARSVVLSNWGLEAYEGAAGNDTLSGGAAGVAYNISGNAGNDSITGNSGDDVLEGGAGNDTIVGGDGNDVITAGDGLDSVNGGNGNDIIYAEARDSVSGGSGFDTLFVTGGSKGINSAVVDLAVIGIERYLGGVANEYLKTTGSVAVNIAGGEGSDTLLGGTGNDTVEGGAGNNSMNGGSGDDTYMVTKFSHNGTIQEHTSNGAGIGGYDIVEFMEGISSAHISQMRDTTTEISSQNHTMRTTLYADNGDVLGYFNVEHGSASQNPIDLYVFSDGNFWSPTASNAKSVNGGTGNDLVIGSDGNDTRSGGAGNDRILGGFGNDNLSGGDGDDSLSGGSGNDLIYGNSGNDMLSGNAGDDTLFYDAGNDMLYGGVGLDTFNLSSAGSAANIDLRAGKVAIGSDSDTIVDFFERIIGTSYADTVLGSSMDEHIIGGSGNDTIAGAGGRDTLEGGNGVDTLSYDTSTASVAVNLNTGRVTSKAGDDTVSGFEVVIGSKSADSIVGSSAADRLIGGSGNDTLNGGAGADTISGGEGFDFVSYEGASTAVQIRLFTTGANGVAAGDTYESIEGVIGSSYGDTISGQDHIGEILLGKDGDDSLYGFGEDDLLDGSVGNDYLNGGTGNDSLYGSEGNDQYYGGDGADVFVFSVLIPDAGKDRIEDFSQASGDRLEFSSQQFSSKSAALQACKQVGSDVVITFNGTNEVHLLGVSLSSISQDAFTIV